MLTTVERCSGRNASGRPCSQNVTARAGMFHSTAPSVRYGVPTTPTIGSPRVVFQDCVDGRSCAATWKVNDGDGAMISSKCAESVCFGALTPDCASDAV